MRFSGVQFTPGLIPTLAAVVTLAVTLSLGRWQLHRADEKRTLQRQYQARQSEPPVQVTGREADAAALQFRPLTAAGEFNPGGQIFIDNQVENGRAGYHVLTPLKLADSGRHVLVNRGWLARGADYPRPPQAPPPAGRMKVQGYGALPVKRFLELSADTVQGGVWQNLTFNRYTQATGLNTLPVILVQTIDNAAGLTPVKEHPDFGIATHQGYAFQWFALSAALVLVYLFVNTRRRRER